MYQVGDKLLKIGMQVPFFTNGKSYEIKQKGITGILVSCNNDLIATSFVPNNLIEKHFKLIDSETQEENKDNSVNNGGSTDYYKFKENWEECQDIIEDREMNFSQGNIFKSAFCFNIGRHNATDYQRELNKIVYFANRELERIKNETIN